MVSSSDSEDDEIDAAKLAALRSVAIDSSAVIQNASAPVASLRKNSGKNASSTDMHASDDDEDVKDSSGGLKLYQTRLQDLLHKHLDKTFGDNFVAPAAKEKNVQSCSSNPDGVVDGGGGGIRLFRRAPPGIVVQPRERMVGPGIKPQLRPSLTVDEDLEEHLVRLEATVVDSESVAEQAKRLREKVLASAKASQVKAALARTKEEERVAQLKRERGEEWLPSVAVQIAKEAANEPKLPPKVVAPAIDEGIDAPLKKKKRKKKAPKVQQLGVVLD